MTDIDEARKIIQESDMKAAELFEKRMRAVRAVAEYKKENGLPVYDEKQEKKVFDRCASYIEDSEICEYYLRLLRQTVELSKEFQHNIITDCGQKGSKNSDT